MKSKFNPRKRPGGLWEARYWARYPDGSKQRKSLYGRDKAELKERYLFEMANSIKGESKRSSCIRMNEYLPEWLETSKDIKASTKRSYDCIIRLRILPEIGDKKVSDVDLFTVQKLLDDVVRNGNSARAAQLTKWVLSKALRRARKLGLTSQIIDTKDLEIEEHTPQERAVWSKEDMEKFLTVIKGEKYELFFALYATYGLRRGEAIALCWEDVDFENEAIHISKQFTKGYREFEITNLKTKSSVRDLPFTANIKRLLNELYERSDIHSGPIIHDIDGGPVTPDKVSRRFNRIVYLNGLPRVVLHSLRHFAATGLKDAGVPLKDTATILGHSAIATTMKYYQHTDLDNEREALGKYLASIGI